MYYYGYFRNKDTTKDEKGQIFKVIIITDFNNLGYHNQTPIELKLSSNPFVVNYSSDNLLKPYKCSTATVSFYQDSINTNFYCKGGNDIYVALLKPKEDIGFSPSAETPYNDNERYSVEWCGYATPNAYNQSFESDFDLFELECQDGLSILRYFDYTQIRNSSSVTIYQVIKGLVAKTGCYKDIYITDVLQTPKQEEYNFTSYLYINENNFFDEDGKAKKMNVVLEDLLTYLSLTAIPYGDKLYIVSYDAIASGYNDYHHIQHIRDEMFTFIQKGFRTQGYWHSKGVANLRDVVNITPNLIAANGTNYSLGSTYNKVRVSNDFYFSKAVDVTDKSYYIKPSKYSTKGTKITTSGTYRLQVNKSDKDGTQIEYKNDFGVSRWSKINFYGFDNSLRNSENLEVNTYWYDQEILNVGTEFTYTERTDINPERKWLYDFFVYNGVGACLCNYYTDQAQNVERAIYIGTWSRSSNYGLLYTGVNASSYAESEKNRQQRVIDFNIKNQFVDYYDYICISGDMWFSPQPWVDVYNDEYANIRGYKANTSYAYNWCKLECLGKYWNGSSWQDDDCCFKLPLNATTSTNAFATNIPIKTNNTFNKEAYYAVRVPITDTSVTHCVPNIKLTFMRPWGVYPTGGLGVTLLKNFKFTIKNTSAIPSMLDVFASDSNTNYVNVVDSDSLEDYEDVSLSINTYDSKVRDNSIVLLRDSYNEISSTSQYTEYDKLRIFNNAVTGFLGRAEEHIINNVCRQYNKPNVILDICLHGTNYRPYTIFNYHFFEGKTFIIDTMCIDYADNTNQLRIVEKLTQNVTSGINKTNSKREYQRNGNIIFNDSTIRKDEEIITYSYNSEELPQFELKDDGCLYLTNY